jgi:hypothetical protein
MIGQLAAGTAAVVVHQESHDRAGQLEDQAGELSVVEAEAMVVPGCMEYSHLPVVAMMPAVEAEEEHSGDVGAAKALEEGSDRTQVSRHRLILVKEVDW